MVEYSRALNAIREECINCILNHKITIEKVYLEDFYEVVSQNYRDNHGLVHCHGFNFRHFDYLFRNVKERRWFYGNNFTPYEMDYIYYRYTIDYVHTIIEISKILEITDNPFNVEPYLEMSKKRKADFIKDYYDFHPDLIHTIANFIF